MELTLHICTEDDKQTTVTYLQQKVPEILIRQGKKVLLVGMTCDFTEQNQIMTLFWAKEEMEPALSDTGKRKRLKT